MAALVQIGLANACSAALLAVLVAVITRIWRNPHLAHALWLIVLLRLVAPPVFELPLPAPQWITRQTVPPSAPSPDNLVLSGRPSERQVAATPATSPASGLFAQDRVEHGGTAIRPSEPSKPLAEPVDDPTVVPTPSASAPPFAGLASAFEALGVLWLVGTVFYLAITTVRVRRFGLAARRSQSAAPDWLDEEIRDLARTVGLRRTPRVAVVEGSLPPMIWSGWQPILLVPRAVADSIAPSQRRLLLLHELVHLRRNDHLIRWFAVGVLAIYWWNPFAWLVVRRLKNAEEECCDAAVLRFDPQQSEIYGEALLAISELISCGSLPAAAVSIGVERKNHLKRRMTMILAGSVWPRLSRPRLAAVIGCGALAIGISLTTAAAQVEPSGSAVTRQSNAKTEAEQAPAARPPEGLTSQQPDSSKSGTPSAVPESTSRNSVTSKRKTQPARGISLSPDLQAARPSKLPDLSDLSTDSLLKILPGDDETQKMLKERYNAAIRGQRLLEYQFEIGTMSVGALVPAARSVLEARLALAKTQEDKSRALHEYVDLVTSYWKIAKAKLDIGGATGFSAVDEAQAREAMFDAKLKLAQVLPDIPAGGHRLAAAALPGLETRVRIAQAEVEGARALVEQSRAEQKRASSNLKYREAQLGRVEQARKSNAVNQQGLDEAINARDDAEASVDSAAAAIRAAQAQVEMKMAQLEQVQIELKQAKESEGKQ